MMLLTITNGTGSAPWQSRRMGASIQCGWIRAMQRITSTHSYSIRIAPMVVLRGRLTSPSANRSLPWKAGRNKTRSAIISPSCRITQEETLLIRLPLISIQAQISTNKMSISFVYRQQVARRQRLLPRLHRQLPLHRQPRQLIRRALLLLLGRHPRRDPPQRRGRAPHPDRDRVERRCSRWGLFLVRQLTAAEFPTCRGLRASSA